MSQNKRFGKRSYKETLLALIVIILIISLSIVFVQRIVRNHYYDMKRTEAFKIATSYRDSLTKTTDANHIINQLLEEKINVALEVTNLNDNEFDNETLKLLAKKLDVDEIDYYGPSGVLKYSNIERLIGWEIYEGHPIQKFLDTNKRIYIEDIRQDVITKNYFKYGYIRRVDGSLIQVGVRASRVKEILEEFELQTYIDEIKKDENILCVNIVDNKGNKLIIPSHEDGSKCSIDIKKIPDTKEIYGELEKVNEAKIYRVYAPIKINEKDNYLVINYSIKDTEAIIKKVSILVTILVLVIFTIILVQMYLINKKDKSILKLAYYDQDTDFPNKHYLFDFLRNTKEFKLSKSALMMVDFSNFKNINLTYGYENGDRIFKKLAYKLKELEKADIKIFRFSDYRFALFVGKDNNKTKLEEIVDKINTKIKKPYVINGYEQYLDVKIAIIEIEKDYKNIDDLIKKLSITLTYIRENKQTNHLFFSKTMEKNIKREDTIEKELRKAIKGKDNTKVYMNFQPLVNMENNKIMGFEALARMNSTFYKEISPIEFIDIAERKGIMSLLGDYLLEETCKFIRTLRNKGYCNIKTSFNVSGMQLLREDFNHRLFQVLEKNKIKGEEIILEITESILIENFDLINKKFKTIREKGIKIALDDFGTGYSSFYRLRELNFDILKIDKHFIDKINILDKKELISEDIIKMAHKINLIVVAEGVENIKQKEYLIKNDCDIIQGYLFSKPLSEIEALEILKNQ